MTSVQMLYLKCNSLLKELDLEEMIGEVLIKTVQKNEYLKNEHFKLSPDKCKELSRLIVETALFRLASKCQPPKTLPLSQWIRKAIYKKIIAIQLKIKLWRGQYV